MTIEEHLREYRATLDAATEDAAASRPTHSVVPIRIRPARTLLVAAVAVAATIAVAFAAVGVAHHSSTPPVGSTPSSHAASTTSVASHITSTTTVVVPNVLGLRTAAARQILEDVGLTVVTVGTNTECQIPPGIVVTQSPAASDRVPTAHLVTIKECDGQPPGASTTLPVVSCATLDANEGPRRHPPTTVTVATPANTSPKLEGYGDSGGFVTTTAPIGWGCNAVDTNDGSIIVDLTPPGVTATCCSHNDGELKNPVSDGVFVHAISACFGCIFDEACAVVPGVATDPDFQSQGPCPAAPAGQTVHAEGNDTYRVDDPPGALGANAVHSVVKYHARSATTSAWIERESCVLPASQLATCHALLDEFLALNPTAG